MAFVERLWWRFTAWNCRRQARALNVHSANVNRRVAVLNAQAAAAELRLAALSGDW